MPRTHQPSAPEYRRESSNWREPALSIRKPAREFEPTAETIAQWVKQAALDDGLRRDGLTTS